MRIRQAWEAFWRIFPHRFVYPEPVWVQPWLCTRCGYPVEGHR